MIKREAKKNILIRFFLNPKIFFLLCLAVVIVISFPVSKNISKKYKIDQEIIELEKEIKSIESTNSDLKKMITYLESDYFVEEQARLNLGLKKEGEEVVVIEEVGKKILNNEKEEKNIKQIEGKYRNAYFWWNYFFSKK